MWQYYVHWHYICNICYVYLLSSWECKYIFIFLFNYIKCLKNGTFSLKYIYSNSPNRRGFEINMGSKQYSEYSKRSFKYASIFRGWLNFYRSNSTFRSWPNFSRSTQFLAVDSIFRGWLNFLSVDSIFRGWLNFLSIKLNFSRLTQFFFIASILRVFSAIFHDRLNFFDRFNFYRLTLSLPTNMSEILVSMTSYEWNIGPDDYVRVKYWSPWLCSSEILVPMTTYEWSIGPHEYIRVKYCFHWVGLSEILVSVTSTSEIFVPMTSYE